MRITVEEEALIDGMRARAAEGRSVEVPPGLLERLVEAAGLQVFGRCKHCRTEVPEAFNCCAGCADERGP